MGPECLTCALPAREHHLALPPGTRSVDVALAWHVAYGTDVDATGALIGPAERGHRARFLTRGQIEQWAMRLAAHVTGTAPRRIGGEPEYTPTGELVLPDGVVAPGQIVEAVITQREISYRPGRDPRAHDVYLGRRGPGYAEILVMRPQLNAVGEPFGWITLGALPHRIRHSPTGMAWGYGGSGPADLARSLLLHAVDNPRCPECGGTRLVVDVDDEATRPLDPYRDHPGLGLSVGGCPGCDDGTAPLPYQRFKWQYVSNWGDEWQIGRAEILQWLGRDGLGADPTEQPHG